jgi:hypothetical protein
MLPSEDLAQMSHLILVLNYVTADEIRSVHCIGYRKRVPLGY